MLPLLGLGWMGSEPHLSWLSKENEDKDEDRD
jgi:hypothetical protein